VLELDPVPAAGAAAPAARLLRLRYGQLPWAVADGSVCEVEGTERLQRNPRPAAGEPYGWLLGERDEVPVFLPAGDGSAPGAAAVVVLQPASGARCGLGVEAVEEVREEPVSRLRLLPAPAASRRWAFPRVVLWEDGLALEIAPEAVPHLARIDGGSEVWAPGAAATLPAGAPRFAVPPLVASSSAGLFIFTLPGFPALSFALPTAQVVEVMSSLTPRPVPGTPEPLLGLCAWRGEPLPVLDLARAVGLPPTLPRGGSFSHGLVARAARSRQLLVIPVERMTGVRPRPFPHSATGAPPFPGACRLLGAFANGEQVLAVPDLDSTLRTSPAEPDPAGPSAGGR
jgi:chemotaxis signal transduction protein